MEALQSVSSLIIQTDKINYDKKTKVLAIDLPGFTFIGNYNKNIRISIILNDIYKVLVEKGIKVEREKIDFFDIHTQQNVHGNTKLKNLMKSKKISEIVDKTIEKKRESKQTSKGKSMKRSLSPKSAPKPVAETTTISPEAVLEPKKEETGMESTEDLMSLLSDVDAPDTGIILDEKERDMEILEESEEDFFYKMDKEEEKKEMSPPAPPSEGREALSKPKPPPPPGGAPPSADAPPAQMPAPTAGSERKKAKASIRFDDARSEKPVILKDSIISEEPRSIPMIQPPKETEYNINMGLQYYNVMMEKKSYLFYVYFSHKELKITDEEGKTVYTTTIKIVTKKKEPPIMDLKIEGEGFEVHPLSGKVEVKKDAVNPPLMIFSVMPLKLGKLKKKGESERRFLNVLVEFEGKIVSHSILSIIVQPKFFKLNIGPLSFNINKGTAIAISIGSIILTILLLIYSIWQFDPTSFTGMDILTGIVPSIGSLLFVVLFIYTLIKGVYPLKQQFQGLLNFDSGGVEK